MGRSSGGSGGGGGYPLSDPLQVFLTESVNVSAVTYTQLLALDSVAEGTWQVSASGSFYGAATTGQFSVFLGPNNDSGTDAYVSVSDTSALSTYNALFAFSVQVVLTEATTLYLVIYSQIAGTVSTESNPGAVPNGCVLNANRVQ